MSQTLAYAIELSGALKAARDAEEFNKKLNGTENAAISVDKSLARLEHQMKQLNEAIKSGKGNTAAYVAELERLKQEYDRVSGAAYGMANSIGQASPKVANFGQAALESSRAVEDLQYGIGGVVNNIPSLVMALGGGAGLTAAISLGAVAVNQFWKEFTEVDPAVKEATEKAKERVQKLKEEIVSINKEIRELRLGKEGARVAENQDLRKVAQDELTAAANKLGGLSTALRLQEAGKLDTLGTAKEREEFKKKLIDFNLTVQKINADNTLAKEKDAKESADKLQKIDEDLAIARANNQTEIEEKLKKKREEEASRQSKEAKRMRLRMEKEANDQEALRVKQENDDLAAREKANERKIEQQNKFDKKRIEEAEKAERQIEKTRQRRLDQISNFADDSLSSLLAKNDVFTDSVIGKLGILEDAEFNSLNRRMDQQKRYYDQVGKMTEQYASAAIDIGQNYIDMIVKGEEDKERKIAVIVMRQAGQALIGNGIRSLGHAAEYAAAGPPGWAQAAISGGIGLGLIGAGMGLGGVATGVEGQIQATASAKKDAEREQKRTSSMESVRDKGVSPSRLSGGGSGGITLNLTYGVSGPLPEDTARLIKRELQTASRRNGA